MHSPSRRQCGPRTPSTSLKGSRPVSVPSSLADQAMDSGLAWPTSASAAVSKPSACPASPLVFSLPLLPNTPPSQLLKAATTPPPLRRARSLPPAPKASHPVLVSAITSVVKCASVADALKPTTRFPTQRQLGQQFVLSAPQTPSTPPVHLHFLQKPQSYLHCWTRSTVCLAPKMHSEQYWHSGTMICHCWARSTVCLAPKMHSDQYWHSGTMICPFRTVACYCTCFIVPHRRAQKVNALQLPHLQLPGHSAYSSFCCNVCLVNLYVSVSQPPQLVQGPSLDIRTGNSIKGNTTNGPELKSDICAKHAHQSKSFSGQLVLRMKQ